VCTLHRIAPESRSDFIEFDPAIANRYTIFRFRPRGSPGEPDTSGAQQYAPLQDFELPVG
jgi:hypothetical protein